MSTITAGNPAVLDAHFAQGDQTSPDAVTFNVQLPDDTVVSYVFGVDGQVTNPSGDYYECAIGVPTEVGEYRWGAVGTVGSTAEVTETIWGTLFVIQSAVDPEAATPPGPMLGPCATWITGEDVAACARFDYGSSPAVFDTVAWEASMALYEISGRVFTGLCDRRVRPCRLNCGCWAGPSSYGLSPFWWTGTMFGIGGGWAWYNERGDTFGCKPMSTVDLAGYPVREIVEVKIDGEVLPEYDAVTGARNWRLDKWRYLVRMDTPGSPAVPNFWPGCQNMSLDADQPGTFEVAYKWGATPPQLGRDAAAQVAVQLFLACGGQACVLPAGVSKVERQGITIEKQILLAWLDPTKGTGLTEVDLFLQAYAGGAKRGRRSAIWSPDVQAKARAVGTEYNRP